MTVERRILILGAGGHAKVVIDIIETAELGAIVGILDDDSRKHGAQVLGYTVLGGRNALHELLAASPLYGVAAIGDNRIRMDAAGWFVQSGGLLLMAVHPLACVARSARIGRGSVVMAGAVVNPDATIGNNVIINTGAVVEHDCVVGDGAHLAPTSALCGGVEIGEGALVGVGAKVLPEVKVGSWALVGAGSTVLGAVPDGASAVGVPARLLRSMR